MFSGDRPTVAEHHSVVPLLPLPSVVPFLSPFARSVSHAGKEYQARKLEARFVAGFFGLLTLVSLVGTGVTSVLTSGMAAVFGNQYGVLLGVFSVVGFLMVLIRFPFMVYSGIVLERAYGLMQQTILGWLKDLVKGLLVGGLIGGIMLIALFWCISTFGTHWWIPLGSILFLFQVFMAVIGPKVLLPFFYSLKPLEDPGLRDRIARACDRAGIRSKGVYVIGFSDKTKKANAALTGLGPSKRIVLSDTLLANMRDEEIEAVFAHEIGHLKLRHLPTGMLMSVVMSFAGLYGVSVAYGGVVEHLGTYPENIAMLPLLGAFFGVTSFLLGPLGHWVSRRQEFAADRFAVTFTGDADPLIRALQKLSRINLADPDPHPLLEALTHSHPSVHRRTARLRGQS